jgi:hypothetical protein
VGAAGYDPDMLVWAYAQGVASSRRMESLCGTDVAFRVICGGNLPGHSTIARFRADFADAVTVLFGQVLILCARLGWGSWGTGAPAARRPQPRPPCRHRPGTVTARQPARPDSATARGSHLMRHPRRATGWIRVMGWIWYPPGSRIGPVTRINPVNFQLGG